MEPIGMIVSALAAGAVAALKPTAEQAVKDAYAGLKALVQRKYQAVPLDALERKPASGTQRDAVAETLGDAGAAGDAELLDKARELAATLRTHDPDAGRSIGVDVERIAGASVRIGAVTAGENATGVRAGTIEATDDVTIGPVSAGVPPRP